MEAVWLQRQLRDRGGLGARRIRFANTSGGDSIRRLSKVIGSFAIEAALALGARQIWESPAAYIISLRVADPRASLTFCRIRILDPS